MGIDQDGVSLSMITYFLLKKIIPLVDLMFLTFPMMFDCHKNITWDPPLEDRLSKRLFLNISSERRLELPLGVCIPNPPGGPLWVECDAAVLRASKMSSWYPLRFFKALSTSDIVAPPFNQFKTTINQGPLRETHEAPNTCCHFLMFTSPMLLSDCDRISWLSLCESSDHFSFDSPMVP